MSNNKINIILGNGQLGSELINKLPNAIQLSRKNLDLSDSNFEYNLVKNLENIDIETIINTTAYTNVDKAEQEIDLAMQINANAVKIIAKYCQLRQIKLIHYSTDFVFDGKKVDPYIENDPSNPIQHYGKTKLIGEDFALEYNDKTIIPRISWVYNMSFENNFIKKILNAALKRSELSIVNDQLGGTTSVADLANATNEVLKKLDSEFKNWGIYHLATKNFANRFEVTEFAIDYASKFLPKLKNVKLTQIKTTTPNGTAERPKNSMLNSDKFSKIFNHEIPCWKNSLKTQIEDFYTK
jgi:dTDP-4-dehydrorhamnose reductase